MFEVTGTGTVEWNMAAILSPQRLPIGAAGRFTLASLAPGGWASWGSSFTFPEILFASAGGRWYCA